MDRNHEAYLRTIGLPDAVIDVATGRNPVPLADVRAPAPWYGYPPALIPFWSQAFIYTGLWQHWFTERPASFVKLYVRADHRVVEVGRTPEQFLAYSAMLAIVGRDGVVPEVQAFAERAGLLNLTALDDVTVATGDDPSGFVALPEFRTQTPLAAAADPAAYDGWFPTPRDQLTSPRWASASPLEASDDKEGGIAEVAAALLDAPDPAAACERALEAGSLAEAWRALNSPGWQLKAAREAVRELERAARDPAFTLVCEGWLASSDGQSGAW